jgi:hypothetical protein
MTSGWRAGCVRATDPVAACASRKRSPTRKDRSRTDLPRKRRRTGGCGYRFLQGDSNEQVVLSHLGVVVAVERAGDGGERFLR